MALNGLASTVFFSGSFRATLATALAEEEKRKSEPSYHFDNAAESFEEVASEAADNMLDDLRMDIPALPKQSRGPKMNSEQLATRMRVLNHLFGDNQVVAGT